eukprot:Phypoly_transcript_00760.p1 GENE.Phypoly_transcript_00760~~Phypoly_transcript_00760.p1  ORF type:complete len:1368 (+),score=261.80 Phypoly_transcript_00760:145-4104(+)
MANKVKKVTDISGLFADFQKLCHELDNEPKYSEKTSILAKNFKMWKGDVYLLCKLLLCRNDLRKYNIREKSAVKILSRYYNAPYQEMLSDLEHGDMPETARKFFVKYGTPAAKSTVTLRQVDEFLQELTTVRSEEAQYGVFCKILPKLTADDVKILMKIIDHDLKINIGPKYVLGALHPDAFTAYRNSNNLELIVERVMNQEAMEKKDGASGGGLFSDLGVDGKPTSSSNGGGGGGGFLTGLSLMIPVKPMLALACHSMNEVISRCSNGMYSEIKYDGERIQIHKKGSEFKCFSRNLKPLPDWKVEQVKEFIPKATKADEIILDGEILLMDTKNHKPLPFGTLGVHKQNLYKDACVCVFLFDILYLNGKVLLNKSLRKRRKIMEKHIKAVKNRVEFSEMVFINKEEDLCLMMTKVMQEGLEGLVIKDIKSIYEPGNRHWIKLKKDYLNGMADSADMVVIGANFGSGSKGGLMSTFLMGVHDPKTNKWKTVCKVGNGHDDETLKELQNVFKPKMVKVDRDWTKAPDWLDIDRTVVPDFIIKDPKKSAVWEVVGSEFTQSKKHTAAAISMRFPRVVRIRDDKDWKTATNLQELIDLSQASKSDLSVSKSKGKKGQVVKKYRPITTDADESSSSDSDAAPSSSSSKPTTSTSVFSKSGNAKTGSFNSGDGDDDSEDDAGGGTGASNAGAGVASATNGGADKGKKGKHGHKPKISREPRILYCGDGKETQTENGDGKQTPPPKLEGSKKIFYMVGDVTSPSGTYLNENMIITHIADDSGKWSDKGVFAAISQKWEYPEQVFKKHPSVLGDAQVVKITNHSGKGNMYVATLIAQHSRSHKLNLEALITCLKHLSKFALANNASVHLPKLKMPNMDWAEIQGLLNTYLVVKSVPTYVYTMGSTKNKPTTAKKQPQATTLQDSDKQKITKKRSLDEDEFKTTTTSSPSISKKRSLDEDEFKSTSITSTTLTTTTTTAPTSTTTITTTSSKKLRVDEGVSVPSPKPDAFANPFLHAEHNEPEDDEDEGEEDDEDNDRAYSDDEGSESDEEADSLRSQILEDFVLTQKASGEGSLLLDAIAGASGDGDDTISMDSDEIEAIAKSATGSSFGSIKALSDRTDLESKDSDAKLLKDVRIVFSGYVPKQEKELAQKAQELGANVSPQWYQVGPLKCTHLICATATPQMENVVMMGGSAYSEKWLLECYKTKTRVPEASYVFKKHQNTTTAPVPQATNKPSTTVHFPQIFSELVISFHKNCPKVNDIESLIQKHGGTLSQTISEEVTHIVSETTVEISMREPCPDACVVSPKWVWESIKKQALLSERPFIVK